MKNNYLRGTRIQRTLTYIFGRRVFGAALTLALAANAIGSEILPPDQLVAGKSYAEWKAIARTWVTEIPWDDLHPFRDRTGANALRNQSGPVWFLVPANTTVPVVRSIGVPDDIILHFALAGTACSTVEPPPYFGRDEEELRACAQGHSLDWSCEVDGVSLANPADYVTTSTLFDFVLPEPNILGLPGGTQGQGVAHGAAVMTRFLPGNHTVHFRGHIPEIGFSNDVTYQITIRQPFAPVLTDATQPANRIVVQTRSTTLEVFADALPAPTYQWFVGGVPIVDATNSTLLITNDSTMMATSNFFARVTNPLGSFDSRTAVVTFIADTEPPTVMVLSSLDGTNLTVRFNEVVDSTTASDSFNYSIDPDFMVTSLTLQPNGTDVLLGISPAISSTLSIMISGVEGLARNVMASTQVVVRAHVVTYGCARYDYYLGLPTGSVALGDLLGAPAYPHSPNITRFKTNMELNTVDEFEGYGTRLTGFLIPPVGGNYVFYFHSDDNGQFSLSTDASPNNLTLLCNEPTWSNRRAWVGPSGSTPDARAGTSASGGPQLNISGPIPLVAGQMYYFEALTKEGGGGDNMGVNWKPPGGTDPVSNTPSIIPPEALASLADPVGQAANVKGPKVSLSVSGNQITFSWPIQGFRLQSKSSLGTPGGWMDVPNGSTSPVTVTIGPGNQFFQLVQ